VEFPSHLSLACPQGAHQVLQGRNLLS